MSGDRSGLALCQSPTASPACSARRDVLVAELPEAAAEEPIEGSQHWSAQQDFPPREHSVAPAQQVHAEMNHGHENRHNDGLSETLTVAEQLLHSFLTLPETPHSATRLGQFAAVVPLRRPTSSPSSAVTWTTPRPDCQNHLLHRCVTAGAVWDAALGVGRGTHSGRRPYRPVVIESSTMPAARRSSRRARCGSTTWRGSFVDSMPASSTPKRVYAEAAASAAPETTDSPRSTARVLQLRLPGAPARAPSFFANPLAPTSTAAVPRAPAMSSFSARSSLRPGSPTSRGSTSAGCMPFFIRSIATISPAVPVSASSRAGPVSPMGARAMPTPPAATEAEATNTYDRPLR